MPTEIQRLITTVPVSRRSAGTPFITVTGAAFGTTPVGTPKTVVYSITNADEEDNPGTADLELDLPITIDGAGFTVLSQPSSATLAPGESVTFSVQATAANIKTYSGNISIVSNAASSPTLVAITALVTLPLYIESDFGSQPTNFETHTDWIPSANGTVVDDTTNVLVGGSSIKLTHNGLSIATCYARKTVSLNWGSAPTKLRIYYFLHAPFTDATVIRIRIETTQDTAYFQKDIPVLVESKQGWNAYEILASEWTTTGAASWSNINRLTVGVAPSVNGLAPVASFGGIYRNPVSYMRVAHISFDDSFLRQYTIAYPILAAHNIRATGYHEAPKINVAGWLTTAQLLTMQAAGWTVGTHGDVNWESSAAAPAQIATCVAFLQGIGITNGWKHASYPFGATGSTAFTRVAANGILTGRDAKVSSIGRYPYVGVGAVNMIYFNGGMQLGNTTTLVAAKAHVDACIAAGKIISFFAHDIVTGVASNSNEWNVNDFEDLIEYIISTGAVFVTAEDMYNSAFGLVSIPELIP